MYTPQEVRVLYGKHEKVLLIRFDYNKKRQTFYTLVYKNNVFELNSSLLDTKPIKVNDISEYDEAAMFQESLIWDNEFDVDIYVLQKFQILLKSIMQDYPCEISDNFGFHQKVYEV